MRKEKKLSKVIIISLCMVFLYFPIFIMAVFSFNSAKSLSHFGGFSGRWYVQLFNNTQLLNAIFVSVSIAVIATICSVVLGTITAIALSISLMLLFSFVSFEKGYMTMLLAHIAFCTPYVITNVYPKVKQLDDNLADAAMDLGATPFQTLTKVIIPQIKPGIFAGALLSFTMSFDDFIISYFVSGNGVENISIVVYNMSKRVDPSIYALSTVILVVILIGVLLGTFVPYIYLKKRGVKNEKAI